MASILVDNVSIDFPVYYGARSLKKTLLHHAVGGIIGYDSRNRTCVHAISGLSFRLEKGDRVGVIGPNGAGKTSLLRALAGIYEPSQGRIRIEGKVTSLIDCTSGFDSESSGYDNLFLRSSILGYSKSYIQDKLDDIIKFSDLGDFLYLPMRMYSSGMTARLVFATVTAFDPEVLLLDEWLGVGDANFIEKAQRRAEEFVNRSSIMVIASHSNTIIQRLCNKVIWLENGTLRAMGTADDILPQYASGLSGLPDQGIESGPDPVEVTHHATQS